MATVASIRADLVGSSAVFRSEVVRAQQQANQSLTAIQAQAKQTAQAIQALSTTAKGFVGFEAIKNGVSALLDAQKAVQQIHFTLLSATGSGAAADAAYAQVATTADKLGLSLQTAELGFAQMSAAATANGISMADQQALFNGVARSATVLHLSADQSGSAILALSQIFGKGKIQAQELQLQLGQAIPGVVPRFQQAVLKMIQGTDLAGKSFQQLLEGGDLTVQRFLPALIDALNQTGAGAEGAATGLNAEANRLSTAWFNLKADLSGGLVGDATIGSIRLLSSSIGSLASTAELVAGVGIARVLASGLQVAGTSLQNFTQQNVSGPQMAAAAEATYTEALAARTAQQAAGTEAAALANTIYIDAAADSAAQAKALQFEALAAHEAAVAEVERTTELLASMKAEGGSAVEIASRNVQLARQAGAFTALTVATETLTAAQVEYDAAVATGNRLAAEQAGLAARNAVAQEAAAAAQVAATVAQAQATATTTASALAGGLNKIGTAALGLVGGPLGAVVLGFGTMAFAIESGNKQAEEFQEKTQGQVDSLKKLREQVQGAIADYGTLHAAQGIAQSVDLFKSSSDQVVKQRAELADLQQQAADITARISSRSASGLSDSGSIGQILDSEKLQQINQRIAALKDSLPGASAAVDDLGAKLTSSLAPSIDAVRGAMDRLRAGASLADIFSGVSSDISASIKNIDAARQKVLEIQGQLAGDATKLAKQAATDGMNNVQKEQFALVQGIASIRAQHLSPGDEAGQIDALSATAAPAIKAGALKDSADAAKKAAEAAVEATKHWQEQAATLNDTLDKTHDELTAQLDSTTKLTPAQQLLAVILGGSSDAYNHAAASVQKKMLAEAQDNAELSKKVLLQQQADKATERSAALNIQLADQLSRQQDQADLDATGVGRGDQEQQELQNRLRIRQQYDQQFAQYLRDAAKPGAPAANDADLAAISANQAAALKIEQDGFQARLAAQADWTNGARTAFQNYIDNAANAASQSQTVFTDAFSGMEDAAVSFETTGKASVKSFVTSALTDLARMETRVLESQVLQMILGAFLPAGTGSVQSLGGSSADYGGINNGQFGGGFNLAGGRANGGPVMPGSMYEVAEGGKPELLTSGGRTYLMTGQGGGMVTPASKSLSSGGTGGPIQLSVTTIVQPGGASNDTSTGAQNSDSARQLTDRMKTVAKQVVSDEMRQGGSIWRMSNGG